MRPVPGSVAASPPTTIALLGARLIALITTGALAFAIARIGSAVVNTPNLEGWLFLMLFPLCLWRSLRIAVIAGDEVVVVRNVWRTYRVPWSDIASIRYADLWPSPVTLTLASTIAIRRKSQRLPVFAQALVGNGARQIESLEAAARMHPGVSVESWSKAS